MVHPIDTTPSAVTATEPRNNSRGKYGTQNLFVLLGQGVGWAAILTLVDSSQVPWSIRALGVVLFCLLMQGVFSLMHDYFHKNAHRNTRVNYFIGFVGSLLFGTSATLHRVNHWGHHVRNRTEAERGDFIHESEKPAKKVALYYFAVFGGLWVGGFVGPAITFFLPYSTIEYLSRTRRFNTYAAAFQQFSRADWNRMRWEAISLAAFCWALLAWGPWHWETLAVCYGAFAVSWSSLQWVYHLRTPLNVVEGAYNLRTNWLVRVLFLNFNYNLTHHRHPGLAWQDLPAHTDLKETQPLTYRWVRMVAPPVPFPKSEAALEDMLKKHYF